MFDLFKMTDNSNDKKLMLALGLTTAGLIIVYYYHQIKLSRLQIEEHERKYSHTKATK